MIRSVVPSSGRLWCSTLPHVNSAYTYGLWLISEEFVKAPKQLALRKPDDSANVRGRGTEYSKF